MSNRVELRPTTGHRVIGARPHASLHSLSGPAQRHSRSAALAAAAFILIALTMTPLAWGQGLEVTPQEVNIPLIEGQTSYTRAITIKGNQKWTFARFKEIDSRIELRASSNRLVKILPSDRLMTNDWFAFDEPVKVDLTVSTSNLSGEDSLRLILEIGSPRFGPINEAKDAAEIIKSGSLTPILTYKEIPIKLSPEAGSDWVWIIAILLVLLGAVVLFRFMYRKIKAARQHPTGAVDTQSGFPKPPDVSSRGGGDRRGGEAMTISKQDKDYIIQTVVNSVVASMSTKLGNVESTLIKVVSGRDGNQLSREDIRHLIEPVRSSLDKVWSKNEEIASQIHSLLLDLSTISTELQGIKDIKTKLNGMEGKLEGATDQLRQHQSETARQLLTLLSEQVKKLEAAPLGADGTGAQQSVPAVEPSKTLEEILGRGVAPLQEDGFDELSGQIDHFFGEKVAQPDSRLDELQQKLNAVLNALRKVQETVRQKHAEVAGDLEPHTQRAAAVAEDLQHFRSRLAQRQLALLVNVPASDGVDRRGDFLEEIGKSIKHEMEKLSDPYEYYNREFENLVTSEIITAVAICEKRVAEPGQEPDLDRDLKNLFDEAGLKEILPREGDSYNTEKQEYVSTVAGRPGAEKETARPGTGKDIIIARVRSRGFYYGDSGTQLCKASVDIYM